MLSWGPVPPETTGQQVILTPWALLNGRQGQLASLGPAASFLPPVARFSIPVCLRGASTSAPFPVDAQATSHFPHTGPSPWVTHVLPSLAPGIFPSLYLPDQPTSCTVPGQTSMPDWTPVPLLGTFQ